MGENLKADIYKIFEADIDLFNNRNFDKKIIRYEKLSTGEWIKDKEIDPNLGYFSIIDDKPIYIHSLNYFSFDYSYLNTNFESKDCGACFKVE
jgi:hypothetical protein